ncbi:MAG: rhodanese-related sulfurtransferase [Alphaproteobacteria bacterium]|nr:rhodanese-related sulfurtransferase [Alphaproteobacteria bacterium]
MTSSDKTPVVVAALYAFRNLPDYADRRAALLALAQSHDIFGTLLLAAEGINGTIAGSREGIDAVLSHIRAWPGFADLEWKEAQSNEMPFLRMKVRLKSEIVTMGVADLNPAETAGTYVAPEDWNELISRDDVIVIDTRNDYEVGIGTFEGAINPQTQTFREFPEWSRRILARSPPPKVAMFCTGGIRCEKASAFLKAQGIPDVYHLKGGILKYLEHVPAEQSLWRGECFVFDRRVSVGHGLAQGSHQLCAICRQPFRNSDDTAPHGGVATTPCPSCRSSADGPKKARAEARQKQMDLAEERGVSHLGPSQAKSSNAGQHQTPLPVTKSGAR